MFKSKRKELLSWEEFKTHVRDILALEERKRQIAEAAKVQKQEISQEQKPLKQAIGTNSIKIIEIIQLIIEQNPDKELSVEFFENLFSDWQQLAVKHDEKISMKCLKDFSCSRIFRQIIVKELEEKYGIKIMSE